jgi:predicted component of type VI protein secretion system
MGLNLREERVNILIWIYAEMRAMKTTVEVPDDLYRQAKAEAALRGRKLKDLIEEGLRLVLEAPRNTRRNRSLTELMKRAQGVIDSGVPDLASNPAHLKGFGRDARHR